MTSVPLLSQRDQLRLVIRLSMACVAACDRGEWVESCRLMQIRDAEYVALDPQAAAIFVRWPEMTKEQLAELLGGGASA